MNKWNEFDSGILQLWVHLNVEFKGLSSKRQNETVSQDGGDARSITTLQQETPSNSPETKKKRKLENDIDEREKTEQARNLHREKVGINYLQPKFYCIFFRILC